MASAVSQTKIDELKSKMALDRVEHDDELWRLQDRLNVCEILGSQKWSAALELEREEWTWKQWTENFKACEEVRRVCMAKYTAELNIQMERYGMSLGGLESRLVEIDLFFKRRVVDLRDESEKSRSEYAELSASFDCMKSNLEDAKREYEAMAIHHKEEVERIKSEYVIESKERESEADERIEDLKKQFHSESSRLREDIELQHCAKIKEMEEAAAIEISKQWDEMRVESRRQKMECSELYNEKLFILGMEWEERLRRIEMSYVDEIEGRSLESLQRVCVERLQMAAEDFSGIQHRAQETHENEMQQCRDEFCEASAVLQTRVDQLSDEIARGRCRQEHEDTIIREMKSLDKRGNDAERSSDRRVELVQMRREEFETRLLLHLQSVNRAKNLAERQLEDSRMSLEEHGDQIRQLSKRINAEVSHREDEVIATAKTGYRAEQKVREFENDLEKLKREKAELTSKCSRLSLEGEDLLEKLRYRTTKVTHLETKLQNLEEYQKQRDSAVMGFESQLSSLKAESEQRRGEIEEFRRRLKEETGSHLDTQRHFRRVMDSISYNSASWDKTFTQKRDLLMTLYEGNNISFTQRGSENFTAKDQTVVSPCVALPCDGRYTLSLENEGLNDCVCQSNNGQKDSDVDDDARSLRGHLVPAELLASHAEEIMWQDERRRVAAGICSKRSLRICEIRWI